MKKTFEWVPEPLDGVFPHGTRWVLEQTNHRKGYRHYIGRVCKKDESLPYSYITELGEYDTMAEAAEQLVLAAVKGLIK